MPVGIYNKLSSEEIIALSYVSALRSWGISQPDAITNSCGCSEITWDTFYDTIDTTDKVWGVLYYQNY